MFLQYHVSHVLVLIQYGRQASWSRGMIPALGAGGPGFKSRRGPIFFSIANFIFIC